MDDPGRHELYLRGFLSAAEQEQYEAQIAAQPLLAAELRTRLQDGTNWDSVMARRASGMLAVVEAFVERRLNPNDPLRIDLLPPDAPSFGTSGEPRVKEERSVRVVEIVNTIIVNALTQGAEQVEILPGDEGLNVWVDSAVERRRMLQLPHHVHEPLMARIRIMSGLAGIEPTHNAVGCITLRHENRNWDVEVTFEFTSRGEAVTLTFVRRD